jgi:hypothetical protein
MPWRFGARSGSLHRLIRQDSRDLRVGLDEPVGKRGPRINLFWKAARAMVTQWPCNGRMRSRASPAGVTLGVESKSTRSPASVAPAPLSRDTRGITWSLQAQCGPEGAEDGEIRAGSCSATTAVSTHVAPAATTCTGSALAVVSSANAAKQAHGERIRCNAPSDLPAISVKP